MRRLMKLICCTLVFSAFIVSSLVSKWLALDASSAKHKARAIHLTQRCARILLWVIGIKIELTGSLPADLRGCLVVSNHQSYLDILVLVAHFPVQFVAKREVAAWQLAGHRRRRVKRQRRYPG